jgi:hypothetical protein
MCSLEGSLGKAVGVLPEIAEHRPSCDAGQVTSLERNRFLAVHCEMEMSLLVKMVCPAAICDA